MGRHFQRLRSGKVTAVGIMVPPVSNVNWDFLSEPVSALQMERLRGIPAGADGMGFLLQNEETFAFTSLTPTGATPITVSGLVSGDPYLVQAAWFLGTRRVSDWSTAIDDTAG